MFDIAEVIKESGLKKEFIARELDISLTTLNNKLSGRTEFLVTEARRLQILLKISDDDFMKIFFNK